MKSMGLDGPPESKMDREIAKGECRRRMDTLAFAPYEDYIL